MLFVSGSDSGAGGVLQREFDGVVERDGFGQERSGEENQCQQQFMSARAAR